MRALRPILCAALAIACSTRQPQKSDASASATTPTTPTTATKSDGGSAASAHNTPAAGDLPAPPDVEAPPKDAEKTASGLAWKVLQPGTGKLHPAPEDQVTVHYTGWTTDGKMFDSSARRGQPATFPLNGVIKGWTEGLQLMVEGEKRRFWIPVELAYNNRPGRPAGMLVFDVELLGIKQGPKPIPAPADVAAPPKDAKKTTSGIAWKIVTPPTGKAKPSASSVVKINYTGWTTDGKMIDSSVQRGEPVSFRLDGAPPGFKEGIGLMGEGEKRLLWIPKAMAMRGASEAPGDYVVFEVELLSILDLSAPPDVAAAPADAEKTSSGLASKVVTKGKGTAHPTKDSVVKVHYTGWTTDGKMFDSSVARGNPTEFPLSGVIPGWTEGLQLMVEGEKRRFWIPEDLAYKGKEGPQGTLVFDVELIEIKK